MLLPLYALLAYLILVVYASLHPFSGWRDLGLSAFAFLDAGWPRYWTKFDLFINVLVYFPLGFLLAQTLRRWLGVGLSVLLSSLLAAALSFCLEALQTWLPSRVPSNLDLACNIVGAGLGSLLMLPYGARFFSRLAAVQHLLLSSARHAEFGLVLLALWLLTQLSPENVLFSTGDVRYLLGLTPAVSYAASSFFLIETCIIVCNTLAIGLILRLFLTEWINPYKALLSFFTLALLIRTLATATLVATHDALAWLTPGARYGLLMGAVLLGLLLLLPSAVQLAVAGLALMAGTVLVNLSAPNPYSLLALASWRQGHFLNFNGLTRLVASIWPFFALLYLMIFGRTSS
ncbi:MAG: VanZ family protein [Pseudomonadota bacterium]